MIVTLPTVINLNNKIIQKNLRNKTSNFESKLAKATKTEKMITLRENTSAEEKVMSTITSSSVSNSSSANFLDLSLPQSEGKQTSSRISKENNYYQNPESSEEGEETYHHYHHQSPVYERRSSWGMGTMMFLFLLSVILSSSTSMVMCSPHGGRGGSSRIQLVRQLTSSIPNQQNEQVLEPLQQQQQQFSRSSLQSQSSGDENLGVRIEDVGGDRGDGLAMHHHRYMIQPQSQLYLPSLLKSSEIGMGINMGGQQEQQGHDDAVVTGGGFYQQQRQAEDEGDDNNHRMSYHPTKLSGEQFHQKNQNLQNEDDSNRAGWETVIDPHLYLLTEWNSNAMQQQRMRRNVGPSLSIVNPLDVLRQRLLLEIARRKMRQSHNQIMANAEMLKNIGRRRRR